MAEGIEVVGEIEYVEDRLSEHPYFMVEFKAVEDEDGETVVSATVNTADIFGMPEEADFLYALKQFVRAL